MAERDLYLSKILGEGALTIHTDSRSPLILGNFSREEGVAPLRDVTYQENGSVTLVVTQEHLAGHFLGPETLPAYKMLELGAMLGKDRRIAEISDARFSRIVKPGDIITALKDESTGVKLIREAEGRSQEVAHADMDFTEQGLNPHEIAMLLEIAAQTVVANMARRKTDQSELLYPLILGVGKILVLDPQSRECLIVVPTNLSDFDKKGRFSASTEIKDNTNKLVASVTDLQFEFATASKIRSYDTFGRNFL